MRQDRRIHSASEGPTGIGTGDDPIKMAANHPAIQAAGLALFRKGHLPVNGEDLAIPMGDQVA